VVVSSGVMYHVMNPVDHFMTYRKLCKHNGLVILETAAAVSDEMAFYHSMRHDGTLYSGYATWFVSSASIDMFMRACYLEPLAFLYVSREKTSSIEICRMSVIARAVSTPAFTKESYARFEEVYHSELYNNKDFATLQQAAMMTGEAKPIEVDMTHLNPIGPNGLGVAAFDATSPLAYTQDDLRLPLSYPRAR
jgi:hypothetical protein